MAGLPGKGKGGAQTLQALDRGLAVLVHLARVNELGVSELARTMGINKSTIYRVLSTLKASGFVDQNPLTGKYALGIRAFEVGVAVANRLGLLEQASPEMEVLAQRFNETVNLAVLDGAEIIYLHKIESSEPLRLGLRVGTRVPAYCSALGKCLLAFLDSREFRNWSQLWMPNDGRLETFTPRTIATPLALADELDLIRRRGFALDDEEYKPGIRCLAAPVYNHLGQLVAAISLAAPAVRLTIERLNEEVGPAVVETARRISEHLGYGFYAAQAGDGGRALSTVPHQARVP